MTEAVRRVAEISSDAGRDRGFGDRIGNGYGFVLADVFFVVRSEGSDSAWRLIARKRDGRVIIAPSFLV